jgi:hypothetical protein
MVYQDIAGNRVDDGQSYTSFRAVPSPSGRNGACEVMLYVAHDHSRVLIDGGTFGAGYGDRREVDETELEALAERFNHAELHRALAVRRNASPQS